MSVTEQRDRQQRERHEREARLNAESPIFFLRDHHVAKAAPALPEKFRAGFEAEAAEQRAVLDGFVAKRREILGSADYTASGRAAALGKEVQRVLADLDARRGRLKRLDDDVERRRGAVLARAAETTEDPTVRYWRLREIRDHIAALDPVMVPGAIAEAAARGRGFDWLSALDSAPVPLYPEIVAKTRAELVEQADPELGALAELQRAHEWTLNFSAQGLREAAVADGVDFSVLAAPKGTL